MFNQIKVSLDYCSFLYIWWNNTPVQFVWWHWQNVIHFKINLLSIKVQKWRLTPRLYFSHHLTVVRKHNFSKNAQSNNRIFLIRCISVEFERVYFKVIFVNIFTWFCFQPITFWEHHHLRRKESLLVVKASEKKGKCHFAW